MSSPIQRLKDKKIVQWVLAYLAGAFVALQLMDALESPLGLSPRMQQSLVILLATGLVVTTILAWGHGERGRQRPSAGEVVALAVTLILGCSAAAVHLSGGDDEVASEASAELGREALRPDPADATATGSTATDSATGESDREADPPVGLEPPATPPQNTAFPAPARETVVPVLSPTSPVVFVGDSLRLSLEPDRPAQWRSADRSVAMVMSDGLVLAVGSGSAAIVATVDGIDISTEVTVSDAGARRVDIEPVGTLRVGESSRPRVVVHMANGQSREDVRLAWGSSDTRVAGVTRDGTVTARSPGSVWIRAEADDVLDSIAVMVVAVEGPAVSAPPPSDEVLFALLERYRVALENRSVADVLAVYPTLSTEGRARWETLFSLGAIRVDFSGLTTRRADAGGAQVEFDQLLAGDRIEENVTRFAADLVPSEEGWRIQGLRSLDPS